MKKYLLIVLALFSLPAVGAQYDYTASWPAVTLNQDLTPVATVPTYKLYGGDPGALTQLGETQATSLAGSITLTGDLGELYIETCTTKCTEGTHIFAQVINVDAGPQPVTSLTVILLPGNP